MRPKIAIIGPRGYPADFSGSSGIDTYVQKIIPILSQDFDINLYTRQWSNSKSSQFSIHPVFCFNTQYFDTSLYSFLATIKALLDNNDIFWFHAPGSCLLLPLVKLFKKKTVTTFHGIDWKRQKWSNPATKFALILLEKIAIKFSDKITTVSNDNSSYIYNQYHVTPVNTFPGFEAKEIFSPTPYLLYLGRLVPEKNIHLLIDAFLDSHEVFSKYKLIISGRLENSHYCHQLLNQAKNYPQKIIFTDYVSGNRKEELLRHAQLFVLPSSIEGHPLALSEALGYGLPCLISDIPVHVELSTIYPNITIFNHLSPDDLRDKLSSAAQSPRQISLHEINSWQSVAKEFIRLFHDLSNV